MIKQNIFQLINEQISYQFPFFLLSRESHRFYIDSTFFYPTTSGYKLGYINPSLEATLRAIHQKYKTHVNRNDKPRDLRDQTHQCITPSKLRDLKIIEANASYLATSEIISNINSLQTRVFETVGQAHSVPMDATCSHLR